MNPLAQSLARLSDAARATAAALQALQAALEGGPVACARYEAAGSPFGPMPQARQMWIRFGQGTTTN
jgi:hypothetical protein